MHTVIETNAYLKAAADAGMEDEERSAVVDRIAADPEAGAIMPGCGGARKLGEEARYRQVGRLSRYHLLRGSKDSGVFAHCIWKE